VAAEQEPQERTVVGRRDPLLGEVFDRRFRIDARLAAGGFGAIYRATHISSGHRFALKVLHANLTSDARVVARFRREGAALTLLRDRHTITAYELGETSDGTLYIVMELLHGESLYDRFRAHGALPWRQVIAIARAACSSLAEAHALGIIHRDLKPTNIHLEPRDDGDEQVKVLDFGIAKIIQGSDLDSAELTHAGQMIGTLDYMSPEQMVGGVCTAASDIYTLGIVMYEMIAGRKPYDDANNATAALAHVITAAPERLASHAIVPAEVDRVVMRCLERQHTDRFQTAVELARALDEILGSASGEPVTVVAPAHVGAPAAIAAPAREVAAPAPPPSEPEPRMITPSVTSPTIQRLQVALEATRLAAPLEDTGSELTPIDLAAAPPLSDATPIDLASAATLLDATPIEIPTLQGMPRAAITTSSPPAPPGADPEDAGGAPRLRPSSGRPPPLDLDTTLVGHLPAAPARPRPTITPHVGTPIVTALGLREAYPMIHRPRPSPMQLPAGASSTAVLPYGQPGASRRSAVLRGFVFGLGLSLAVLLGVVIANRL
jgi:eukaryotic-like serine/threonine-protein kinase